VDFGQVQGASYALGEAAVAGKMLLGALPLAPPGTCQFGAAVFVQNI